MRDPQKVARFQEWAADEYQLARERTGGEHRDALIEYIEGNQKWGKKFSDHARMHMGISERDQFYA